MRAEEEIVGDEESRTETPSSSTIPPDHLRCRRTSGLGWRCKRWKFYSGAVCEHHYNMRLKQRGNNKLTTMDHHHQVIEKKRLGKRRRYTDFFVSSSSDDHDVEEDDNFIVGKKSRNSTKDSDSKEMEKYSISELIIYLKSSFLKQEFDNVEKILEMREDKIKMEKQEAQNRRAQFQKELGIFETMCGQLTSEVEEKKKAIFEVKDNIAEMEIKNLDIQDALERSNRRKDDLKEKVGSLEKELEVVEEREKISEERFTKMSWDLRERLRELERKNRELEASKRRDEGGTEVSKKRFEQSEIQVLLEPQASGKIYAEPRGSLSLVSCSQKGKDSRSEKRRIEGVIEKEDTDHDRGFFAPANSDSISQSSTRARVPEEAKKCGNEQTKIQSETSCVLKDSCSPNLKEALNCGGRIYASAKVDLDCCSPRGKSRVAQPAGVTRKSEATHALEGATLSQIKIKEEVLNCDEKLCTSPLLDSTCHSARGKNSQETPLSRQKSISPLVSEERKGTEVRHTRFQTEASCASAGSKFSQVKIREEALNCIEKLYTSASGDSVHHSTRGGNTKESTPSRQGLTSLQQSNESENTQTKFQSEASCALSGVKFSQQFEQKRGAAEQILSDQFEIMGTSCKQSRNPIAENDSEKDAKELGADCDGISAFLCDLRRLKAKKPNLTLKNP